MEPTFVGGQRPGEGIAILITAANCKALLLGNSSEMLQLVLGRLEDNHIQSTGGSGPRAYWLR